MRREAAQLVWSIRLLIRRLWVRVPRDPPCDVSRHRRQVNPWFVGSPVLCFGVGPSQQDVGSGVGSVDADVVEAAVDGQGDDAGVINLVVSEAWLVKLS